MPKKSDEIASLQSELRKCLKEVDRLGLTKVGALLNQVIEELDLVASATEFMDKTELTAGLKAPVEKN